MQAGGIQFNPHIHAIGTPSRCIRLRRDADMAARGSSPPQAAGSAVKGGGGWWKGRKGTGFIGAYDRKPYICSNK